MQGDLHMVDASAAALAKMGASKGGKARAAKLTAEQRSDAARRASEARWGKTTLDATHAGEIVIGDRTIACAVLDGGTRVLSQSTVLTALGRVPDKSRRGAPDEKRAPFLSAANLRSFISPELMELDEPVRYRLPDSGARLWGYKAEILPMVCEVYLDADEAGAILPKQRDTVVAAQILIRGLARVGIIALVDEATGYQEVRARRELQQILEAYVLAEFRPWVKTFPDEFFQEIYKLQGWEYRSGTSKRTPYVGKLINEYVYSQLPDGVLEELRQLNPADDRGRRSRRHHQHLTADTGHPHLDKQISTVTTLMRISRSKQEFEELFERAFPPAQARLPLVIDISTTD
jgi:P63C domain